MLTPAYRIVRVLLALCVALMGIAPVAASYAASPAVDVFGRPLQAASAAADSASPSATTPLAEAHQPLMLPEFMRPLLAASVIWQGTLNARIAGAAQRLHVASSATTWFTLIGVAFLYGVLHAVGPGHGKLVASTYLGSRDTRIMQAVSLATWSAAVQATSAIVLVFGSVWLAKEGVATVLSSAASLDVASYALLCLAGGWTVYSTLARRDCCANPAALKLVPDQRSASTDTSREDASYLGAKLRLHAAPSAGMSRFGRSNRPVTSQILATGFASGVRPCVGSIFVLIASVAAHAPWVGIAATFAIGAGVALTVTLFGLGAVGANRFIIGRSFRLRSKLQAAQRIAALTGASLIVLFGAVQTALILMGYVQPALT